MENLPLLCRLKAWWTEGQIDERINKQTEGTLDTLDWYLTSYQILTKSIILLEKYELLNILSKKLLQKKLKVYFVDLKVIGIGNNNLWLFSYFCINT